jgi:hypothetical protein
MPAINQIIFPFPIFILLNLSVLISGCSAVNFSANYYTPPENYQQETLAAWQAVKTNLPLKYDYAITFIEGSDSRRLKGIPAISGNTVHLPVDFLKYVYQNYYQDRARILISVIAHEVCHREFNLPSSPPAEHFKTDVAAIKLMGENKETAENYYQSLVVMKNYWFARKGMAGHALNLGFNAASAASVLYGGPGFFGDLYGTDLNKRLGFIRKQYKIKRSAKFEKTKE